MAAFKVAAGTDWIQTLVVGSSADRWRLDDYDIWAHVKKAGETSALIELDTTNGKLVISDPVARRLEINVGWDAIAAIEPGPFEFDLLLENKADGIRSRSGPHSLTVTPGITNPEA